MVALLLHADKFGRGYRSIEGFVVTSMWLREKPSHFCEGFSSIGSTGAEDEIRTRDPLLGNTIRPVSDVTRQSIS